MAAIIGGKFDLTLNPSPGGERLRRVFLIVNCRNAGQSFSGLSLNPSPEGEGL